MVGLALKQKHFKTNLQCHLIYALFDSLSCAVKFPAGEYFSSSQISYPAGTQTPPDLSAQH